MIRGKQITTRMTAVAAVFLLAALLCPLPCRAAQPLPRISAEQAQEQILAGKALTNVRIKGNIQIQSDPGPHDVVLENCVLDGNLFIGDLTARATLFSGYIILRDTIINGTTQLVNAHFNGDVDFSGAVFQESASFENSRFSGRATFRDTVFKASASFENSAMENVLDLTGSQFHAMLIFKGASLHRISLESIDVDPEMVLLTWGQVAGKLVSIQQEPGRIVSMDNRAVLAQLGFLEDLFITNGRLADTDRAHYSYKVLERKFLTTRETRWPSIAWQILNGFGTMPWNAFSIMALVPLVFFLIYLLPWTSAVSLGQQMDPRPLPWLLNYIRTAACFSLKAFTVRSFEDIEPLSDAAETLHLVQRILILVLLFFFVSPFVSRLIR